MNERVAAYTLMGVLAVGLVALFFATYEKEEYEVRLPPTGEAATNRLLAAERLLDSLGYDVQSFSEFAPSLELPPENATALALFSYRYMEEDELTLLLEWVSQGGHLIIEIEPRYGLPYDPVFTPLGIKAVSRDSDDEFEFYQDGEPVEAEPVEEVPADAGAAQGREHWGSTYYDNTISIELGDTEPLWSIHDQHGVFATQVAYDEGKLTAVADINIFSNRRIANYDEAFLLTQMVGPAVEAGAVWLLHSSEFPSLWSLLADYLGEVLIAGAALLAMCLWWASQRFGPRLAPPPRERKAFVEHVEANGRFLWRHDRDGELLGATQHAFLRDATRRHAPLRRMDDGERDAYLARVCGVSANDASNALSSDHSRRHGDFLTRIQLIKTMWNRL